MMPSQILNTSDLPTILILDDDLEALEEIQEILELEEFHSVAASGVQDAVDLLKAHLTIRLVVTDVHICGRDGEVSNGVDFITTARETCPDRSLSFVVLSGDAGAIAASIQTGAIDFLTKPLMPEALLSAVQKVGSDRVQSETALSDTLMRKVEETTRSLQHVSSELADRERELSESREAYERRRLQGGKLRQGLLQGDIRPWFQPQTCLRTGAILGFEALVRWDDPVLGMQSPAMFLPLAQEIGLMTELDAEVQRQAFEGLKKVRDCGRANVDIGINVTAGQLAEESMIDDLFLEIERAGLDPENVGIEVLESAMLDEESAQPIKANINRLADLGFMIELDDFGTGHAGLSSLRDLSVHRIKIDRSFVRGVHQDTKLQKFTRALIGLAKTLGIKVLAEGVETEAELAWLQSEGCDVVQGYFIAKPMPMDAAVAWASERGPARHQVLAARA